MTRVVRTATAGLLLLTMLFAATGVAAAHAVLVATDPVKGTELSSGPNRVSATFNEALQTTFAAMTVVGPDGHLWSTGPAQVSGAMVSVSVRPLGPVGAYTVNYRVTSADGHPVSGAWSFQLTTPGTGQPGPPVPAGHPGQPGDRGDDAIPVWPFAVGAVLIVGAGLWRARPKS